MKKFLSKAILKQIIKSKTLKYFKTKSYIKILFIKILIIYPF